MRVPLRLLTEASQFSEGEDGCTVGGYIGFDRGRNRCCTGGGSNVGVHIALGGYLGI